MSRNILKNTSGESQIAPKESKIFPRVFLSVYIFLLYYSTMWFMALPEPSLEQSGLISIIVGAGAAWFGLYAGTSKGKTDH